MSKHCVSCLEWKQEEEFVVYSKNGKGGTSSSRCKLCLAEDRIVLKKICTKCGVEKKYDKFYRRKASPDGLQPLCVLCKKQKDADHYKANAPARIVQAMQYVQNNRTKYNASRRVLQKRKMVENVVYRLSRIVRSRLNHVLKGGFKRGKSVEYLGCTFDTLKIHIETQFLPGMTWENYGVVWQIDHIRPLATIDPADDAAVREVSRYTNLRPLWAEKNMSLGGKLRQIKYKLAANE